MGKHAGSEHHAEQLHWRAHGARERRRRDGNASDVAGDGKKVCERDHDTRRNVTAYNELLHLRDYANLGVLIHFRLLERCDHCRGTERRDANDLSGPNVNLRVTRLAGVNGLLARLEELELVTKLHSV